MSELTLLVLRFGFLTLMWVFIFMIIYALRTDLFGARVKRLKAESIAGSITETPRSVRPAVGKVRLVITSGMRAGTELSLDGSKVTIGRAAESTLVIRDDYTSTHHAELAMEDGRWFIYDLDSTNGTFVAGHKVKNSMEIPIDTPIRIGTTTFELRN